MMHGPINIRLRNVIENLVKFENFKGQCTLHRKGTGTKHSESDFPFLSHAITTVSERNWTEESPRWFCSDWRCDDREFREPYRISYERFFQLL